MSRQFGLARLFGWKSDTPDFMIVEIQNLLVWKWNMPGFLEPEQPSLLGLKRDKSEAQKEVDSKV